MKKLVLLAIMLLMVSNISASSFSFTSDYPPENFQDSIIKPKLLSDTITIPYVYKVNKYHIVPPYGKVDTLGEAINYILATPHLKLTSVQIFGSASPEGPWLWNVFLGESRAKALVNYLTEHTAIDPQMIKYEGLAEEWRGMVDSLETHPSFPYRDSILSIVSNEPNKEQRKVLIKKIENGKIWSRLIREIFPPLRNARVKIDYYTLLPPIPIGQIRLANVDRTPIFADLPQIPVEPFEYMRFYAVKTNVAFLAAACANIGFEAELWPKWSLDLPFWYSPYDIKKPTRKIRLLGIQPELRYWTGERAGDGAYVGVHGHVFGFNVALDDQTRYQDPNRALWGVGLGAGYAWSFGKGKHFYLDCGLGVGYANIIYDKYRNWSGGPDVSPRYESHLKKDYWGLTRFNISVGYKWYKPRNRR